MYFDRYKATDWDHLWAKILPEANKKGEAIYYFHLPLRKLQIFQAINKSTCRYPTITYLASVFLIKDHKYDK